MNNANKILLAMTIATMSYSGSVLAADPSDSPTGNASVVCPEESDYKKS